MTKVCHLTSVHPRFDGRIFRKECKSLSAEGYDVSLIVADGKGDDIVEGIKIFDVGTFDNRVKRILRSSQLIKKKALQLDCDIYHFHDPELIFTGLALKKSGKKVIFDMHENVPGTIEEKSYLHPLLRIVFSFLYKKIEIYSVKRFDGIVSTRESINERLHLFNKNIVLITNYPIVDKNISRNYDVDSTICFAGGVSSNWQHKEVIKAIENISDVSYNLAGPADESYLEELKKHEGWRKVNFKGKISFEEVKSIYRNSTIGIAVYVYSKNMDGKRGNLANTKLFEYMNWELPIICTDFSLWKEIIEDEIRCGICVNPYDINEITKAINYLIENPKEAILMGKRGREAVLNKYNWDELSKKLISFYKDIEKIN